MFIGREQELKILNETYDKPGFQMTVIYGRRRIGKSRLITEFIKDKKASYYVASQTSLEDNVRKWGGQFIDDIAPELEGAEFSDLENFFKFVGNTCKDERVIIALDEIPYVAEADESFLSRFQIAIDTILAKKSIYLIICGSAISFMEKEILSEKSPVFGRRTNQIFLKPFDYLDSAKFVPKYSSEEKAIVYGVTGGVAKYLSLFDDRLSLDQNIINNYFTSSGYLFEEPHNLLTQEFRTINTYNSVIEACSNGANKVNEISDRTHESTATLSYVLKNLMTVGVISKVFAITDEKNKKKVSYEITDGMYRFWYRFVSMARTAIEMGRGDVYYQKYVKDKLHEFMGEIFEYMCRYYVLLKGMDGELGCFVTNAGKWWGNGHDRKPTDIDVVGIDNTSNKALIGECKFKNEQIDKGIYEALMDRKGLIDRKYEEVQFLFFSLSGYSKWVLEHADKDKVKLLTLEDLYK
ncbi:ATP-binding protein [Butyrivibrio sp. AD3002]|uniref:ATP-binding protein n=1 Tax=Butyrivibrio sp. AD3002 TaxID=1280670 RepID=UPI0003B547B1|nr:ATP-binding protein [Butyrivibrio sp. AD3002]